MQIRGQKYAYFSKIRIMLEILDGAYTRSGNILCALREASELHHANALHLRGLTVALPSVGVFPQQFSISFAFGVNSIIMSQPHCIFSLPVR